MVSDFEIKSLPAQNALVIRTRTPVKMLGQVVGAAFGAVIRYLEELGEQPAGPSFAVYYNSDMQDLDMAAGFIVSKSLPGKGEIQPGEIPAGTYATCLYTGPYSKFAEAYAALSRWLEGQNRSVTQVAYELYLDDPSKTPHDRLRTILMQPILPEHESDESHKTS